MDRIEFLPEPVDAAPESERIHGTVTTRTGMVFTGYVAWDQDERYGADLLQGTSLRGNHEIPFQDISVIRRDGSEAARVTLVTGEEIVLRGTNDVNEDNKGIVVSDPEMGVVVVPWERFGELRLHPRDVVAEYETFDGGAELQGTVRTRDGRELTGRVRWDRDESTTWDMLDGRYEELQMRVEFSRIASIRKFRLGSLVELRDGRSFYLFASQDVNWTNRGIEVHPAEGDAQLVRWEDFREFTPGG